jgi:diaminopropionate ammonia-lyase
MQLTRFPAHHVRNPCLDRARPYGPQERAVLNQEAFRRAKAEIASWPGYAPTPLVALPGLAARLNLGAIAYKDEGRRFGLKSFKALGGAYAVLCLLQEHLARRHGVAGASAADLVAGRCRDLVRDVTVATATDGNHGRSVAWGAEMFGCRCIIYLHEHVSLAREAEIARLGAEIRRVPGSYDDSVRLCAEDARANGWLLVADTSVGGEARVPAMVMQGYTLLVDEMMAAPEGAGATHVFVPGAVGGLAAAVVGPLWETMGPARPRIVVVEPMRADCISRSLARGELTAVPGDVNTFMACLAAGEVSPAAWTVLRCGLDDAVAIPDEAAKEAMRLLAEGLDGDPPLVSGESGCAATAGLIAAALDPSLRAALGLGPASRVVAIGSEGATDEETYRRVVGRPASEIERRAA